MFYESNISAIEDLALSEGGVFTTAQAARLGIPRDALAYAARAGRIERVAHGAYRLASVDDGGLGELCALWKLTMPDRFTHERMRRSEWDGIAVCGSTASFVLGIGDLYPNPYQFAVRKRFNSRRKGVCYKRLDVLRDDTLWDRGFPVTRPELTIATLVWAHADPSLVADVFVDAVRKFGTGLFDISRLRELLGDDRYGELLESAHVHEGGPRRLVQTDSLGHVALVEVPGNG